jgi:ribose transport system permease protein
MSIVTVDYSERRPSRLLGIFFQRLSLTGTIGPVIVLALIALVYVIARPHSANLDGFNTLLNAAAAVGLAAAGVSIIAIAGGFDFSVGSALAVVNVVVATQISASMSSQIIMIPVGLLVGATVGFVNGLLVTRLRIPSIVATLATSFFWGGIALLVLSQPGGSVPPEFVSWFTGNLGGFIPGALVLLLLVIGFWVVFKRTRSGRALYAVGGDPSSARANGVNVKRTLMLAYTLGGLLYGLSGLFLTATTASGDPNLGGPLLLSIFAAVAIGGVRFGGGRGDMVGGIIGALILYMISDILFSLGVNSFYTNIFNGAFLLVAVGASSLSGFIRLPRWLGKRTRGGLSIRGSNSVGGVL